jgi:hypothetical protein
VAFLAVIRPLTLAVVADAAFSLVFLLGYVTIGLVVTLRRPATDRLSGPCTGRVSGERHELRGLREDKCVAPYRCLALP